MQRNLPSPQHKYWTLIWQMTGRDIAQRYRGSMFGLLWSFLTPMLMLAVYTFVFSTIFKARWATAETSASTIDFALILFCGLSLHTFFSDVMMRAPSLIASHANFVKKVVFPLEILPVMITGSALFHYGMNVLVLLFAIFFIKGTLPLTALWLPVILIPFMVGTLGLAWLLASLGVFIKDITHIIGLAMTLLLFLSPIFYPIDALPEKLQPWMHLNPLTLMIETIRNIMLWGIQPDWTSLLYYSSLAFLIISISYFIFQKTKPVFADLM